MPHRTLTNKSKATTKSCFSHLLWHPAWKRSGFIMVYTYLPRTQKGKCSMLCRRKICPPLI